MTKRSNTHSSLSTCSAMDALCKDLVHGLHAASQPLTILRASLSSPAPSRNSIEDMRKTLKRSAKEVERLCLFFDYLQETVLVGSVKAELHREIMPNLVLHTIEGVDLLFEKAQVGLTVVNIINFTPFILIDSSRFQQALYAILLVALGAAVRGDEVIVTSTLPGTSVEISIRQALAAKVTLTTETRLNMALAAANLRSQGAALIWQEDPFTAQIALPVAEYPASA